MHSMRCQRRRPLAAEGSKPLAKHNPTTHHIPLLDVRALLQQQLAAGKMSWRYRIAAVVLHVVVWVLGPVQHPAPIQLPGRLGAHGPRRCVRPKLMQPYPSPDIPFPAARSKGGSPQWSDSLSGAPCRTRRCVRTQSRRAVHGIGHRHRCALLRFPPPTPPTRDRIPHLLQVLLHPIIIAIHAISPYVGLLRHELAGLRGKGVGCVLGGREMDDTPHTQSTPFPPRRTMRSNGMMDCPSELLYS